MPALLIERNKILLLRFNFRKMLLLNRTKKFVKWDVTLFITEKSIANFRQNPESLLRKRNIRLQLENFDS